MRHHLAIQVSDHFSHFFYLKDGAVSREHSIVLEAPLHAEKRTLLENEMQSIGFLDQEFDDITLSWASKRSTLVPNAVFTDSNPTSIFELCYGKDATDHDIDYNRIAELSIINVYEIPDWVKRLFVLKFPQVVIQHEGTHLLRQAMHSSAFYLKATVVLYKDYFQLTLVKHNNLEFYSYFDYQNDDDVLYHLMFTLQQKELTDEKGKIELVSSTGDQDLLKSLTEKIQRVKELDKLTVESPEHHTPKSQLLCV